ncbi:Vinculin [Plasmodiophora brassicae]|uniref:Uncharacterized protein n=2 Tax=Plasmodiophora brassicae TaxID=37360 RepID=A0A3P3Y4L9_PLABS|nr:unnamed protein product [Plasmodiophora brassicae]
MAGDLNENADVAGRHNEAVMQAADELLEKETRLTQAIVSSVGSARRFARGDGNDNEPAVYKQMETLASAVEASVKLAGCLNEKKRPIDMRHVKALADSFVDVIDAAKNAQMDGPRMRINETFMAIHRARQEAMDLAGAEQEYPVVLDCANKLAATLAELKTVEIDPLQRGLSRVDDGIECIRWLAIALAVRIDLQNNASADAGVQANIPLSGKAGFLSRIGRKWCWCCT